MSVIAGPASADLASRLAGQLGGELTTAELRVFSDGESKVRLGKVGRNCIVVQSTYPPTDTHLMQAMMIAKKCADDGAEKIFAVIPYLAYARQDKVFLEGEIATVALVAKLLQAAGITHVVTVDMHSKLGLSHFASIENVSSIPLLAEYAKKMKLARPVVVSPDAGGADRAREFAKILNVDPIALKKSRDRHTGEVSIDERLDADVAGRDAVIVDDMISSGGSIIKAAEVLRRKDVGKIYAMCAHALMIGDAAHRIKAAGVQDIIATNSIPGDYARVDMSPAIAAALKSRLP